jgi:S1-C subfamily serine protease
VKLKGSQEDEPVAAIGGAEGYNLDDAEQIEALGGSFAPISKDESYRLNIEQGVKVVAIEEGKLKEAGVPQGFVITKVDKQEVGTPKELKNALKDASGGVLIEGFSARGERQFYGLGF